MDKFNLKDTSFLMPVRIDSEERLMNLILIIEFIKYHFDTSIIVLEADKKEMVKHSLIDHKIFIEDHDPIFHRTRYLNQMTKESKTSFLAIWDTDILVESIQLEKSIKQLRTGQADMVFPYSGTMYNVPEPIRQLYISTKDLNILNYNIEKFRPMYGHFSVGGAFLVNKDAYIEAGMENEQFYGWGAEDIERVKRWEILGYKIERIEGPLFHLQHPRNSNSWFGSQEIEIKNRKELLNICKRNTDQLKQYSQIMNKS